ncbi:hypothetical protein ABZ619_15595 [Streptomyces sp. NPDC007851]|uniref:hypothetical protein n=1 Tax=Streptomyces sp. NPDC007851 TaxID=3155008 RepID=UPI0033FB9857
MNPQPGQAYDRPPRAALWTRPRPRPRPGDAGDPAEKLREPRAHGTVCPRACGPVREAAVRAGHPVVSGGHGAA